MGVAVTLHELGGLDAHGAVVGGKGLVQLGHVAADGRGRIHQIDLEARGAEIQGGLEAADSASDDHHVAHVAILHLVLERDDFFIAHRYFTFLANSAGCLCSWRSVRSGPGASPGWAKGRTLGGSDRAGRADRYARGDETLGAARWLRLYARSRGTETSLKWLLRGHTAREKEQPGRHQEAGIRLSAGVWEKRRGGFHP